MTIQIVPTPLPNQIADGQAADAAPMMSNFNYLATSVNALGSAIVVVGSSVSAAVMTTGSLYQVGKTGVTGFSLTADNLGEYNSTLGEFIPVTTGIYLVNMTWTPNFEVTPTLDGLLAIEARLNSSLALLAPVFYVVNGAVSTISGTVSFLLPMTAGNNLGFWVTANYSAGTIAIGSSNFSVCRVA